MNMLGDQTKFGQFVPGESPGPAPVRHRQGRTERQRSSTQGIVETAPNRSLLMRGVLLRAWLGRPVL